MFKDNNGQTTVAAAAEATVAAAFVFSFLDLKWFSEKIILLLFWLLILVLFTFKDILKIINLKL